MNEVPLYTDRGLLGGHVKKNGQLLSGASANVT